MYVDKQQKQQYDDVSPSHRRMKWCGKCTWKHLSPFVSCFNYSGIYKQPQHQLQHNVGYSPSLSNSPIIPTTVSSRCGKILLGRVLLHAPEPPCTNATTPGDSPNYIMRGIKTQWSHHGSPQSRLFWGSACFPHQCRIIQLHHCV